jgi:hypothetical protein
MGDSEDELDDSDSSKVPGKAASFPQLCKEKKIINIKMRECFILAPPIELRLNTTLILII